jgi:hypothetical protein
MSSRLLVLAPAVGLTTTALLRQPAPPTPDFAPHRVPEAPPAKWPLPALPIAPPDSFTPVTPKEPVAAVPRVKRPPLKYLDTAVLPFNPFMTSTGDWELQGGGPAKSHLKVTRVTERSLPGADTGVRRPLVYQTIRFSLDSHTAGVLGEVQVTDVDISGRKTTADGKSAGVMTTTTHTGFLPRHYRRALRAKFNALKAGRA